MNIDYKKVRKEELLTKLEESAKPVLEKLDLI